MASGRIGFIGSGRMATAIIRGWNAAGTIAMSSIAVSAPSTRCTGPLKAEIPDITVAESNVDVVQRSTIVIIAVKPHILPAALQSIKRRITPAHLVVTIAAGVTTAQVEAMLGKSVRVVRVVPNTPCAVRCNAGAVCKGRKASDADTKRVQKLFASLSADGSEPDALDEKLMDAVTGVAGSGPAFVFTFIEALADGGVYSGLPRHVAARLAAQTVLGAAKLVLESGEHPAALRDAVCSPGGTTIEGVRALEEGGLRAAVIGAVAAASTKGAVLREQAAAAAAEAAAAEQSMTFADEEVASMGPRSRAGSSAAGSASSSPPGQLSAPGFNVTALPAASSAGAASSTLAGAVIPTTTTSTTTSAHIAMPASPAIHTSSQSTHTVFPTTPSSNSHTMAIPSTSMSPSASLGLASPQAQGHNHHVLAHDAGGRGMTMAMSGPTSVSAGMMVTSHTQLLSGSGGPYSSQARSTGSTGSPPPSSAAEPMSDSTLHMSTSTGSVDPLAGLAPAPSSLVPGTTTQQQGGLGLGVGGDGSGMAEILASTLPGASRQ